MFHTWTTVAVAEMRGHLLEANMREDEFELIDLGAVSEETKGGVDTEIEDREPLF